MLYNILYAMVCNILYTMLYNIIYTMLCYNILQEEEKRLRDEHISFQQQELALERERQEELLKDEEDAKKRVATDLKG